VICRRYPEYSRARNIYLFLCRPTRRVIEFHLHGFFRMDFRWHTELQEEFNANRDLIGVSVLGWIRGEENPQAAQKKSDEVAGVFRKI
jgi:hypothetical protein